MRSAAIVVGAALSLAWTGCASPNRPTTTEGPAIAIEAPVAVAPLANTFPHKRPTFTVTNATRTGPDARLTYRFDVATDATFSTIVARGEVPEGPAQTAFALRKDLQSGVQYVWRAQAIDTATGVASEYSAPQVFTTVNPDDGNFPYVLRARAPSSPDSCGFSNRIRGLEFVSQPSPMEVSGDTLGWVQTHVSTYRAYRMEPLNFRMTRNGTHLSGTAEGHMELGPPSPFDWFVGGTSRLPSDRVPGGFASLSGTAADDGTLSGTFSGYVLMANAFEWQLCRASITWTLAPG